ncbi:MAG: hypothetical protein BWY72_00538 [Bacteroidetes bacterium ADurb.Bin416]|nr:MAG: hypothetical protein BWY72_00538 [Bacteroidetes bacterium ADurb.Bin416]
MPATLISNPSSVATACRWEKSLTSGRLTVSLALALMVRNTMRFFLTVDPAAGF